MCCQTTPPLGRAVLGDAWGWQAPSPLGCLLTLSGPSSRTPFSLLSFFHNNSFRIQFKIYSVYDFFYPTIQAISFFPTLTHTLRLWFWPWLNCHPMIPGMGSSSYQLAYKVSQRGDDAINFSFAIKPSSENMIVIMCVCVCTRHDTRYCTWII